MQNIGRLNSTGSIGGADGLSGVKMCWSEDKASSVQVLQQIKPEFEGFQTWQIGQW